MVATPAWVPWPEGWLLWEQRLRQLGLTVVSGHQDVCLVCPGAGEGDAAAGDQGEAGCTGTLSAGQVKGA